MFKEKNDNFGIFNFLNEILKIYRKIICKFFFVGFDLKTDENFTNDEISCLEELKKERFYLNKDYEYFYSKYKLNPENNFRFYKVYKKSKLVGLYILKEDLKNQKTYIVDCIIKDNDNLSTKFVAIKSAIEKRNSVIFWEQNSKVNFLEKIIFNIFRRKKINIIYYNHDKFDQSLFFKEFFLGYSDNF